MEAYYSELPNKQADQNKQVWREDFFSYITQQILRTMMDNFLICYINIESMVEINSKKLSKHARLSESSTST